MSYSLLQDDYAKAIQYYLKAMELSKSFETPNAKYHKNFEGLKKGLSEEIRKKYERAVSMQKKDAQPDLRNP